MNLKQIKKRLKHLYSNWNQHKSDLWSNSSILLVSTSQSTSSTSVSQRFFIWLLGYNLADTIAIFTPKEIHFICNKQKASLLKPLVGGDVLDIEIVVHEKGKGDGDGFVIMDRVLMDLRVQSRLKYLSFIVSMTKNRYDSDVDNDHNGKGRDGDKDCPLVVGCVEGESPTWGKLMKKKANEFRVVDIKDGLSKFALLAKVNHVEKSKEEEEEVESVFWGFKRSQDQRKLVTGDSEKDIDIYLQELSKEAEDKILLAEVKKLSDEFGMSNTIRKRRSAVVEELDGDEWVLV
ncbi:DNA helicase [Ranunculus cassubicifolius]